MKARLIETAELCPEVRQFVFEAVSADRFAFTPGQFVSLVHEFEGREVTRAYSIASAPDGNRFELCLNRVKEGVFSPWLFAMNPGDTVNMAGPLGYFVLRNPARDALFVATGTGIAPIRGIVHWLFEKPERNRDHEYWLVFGTRYEHSIYYRGEFEQIERENPNFHYVPTLSRGSDDWPGRRGYVQDHVREIVAGRADVQAYICGLHQMVDANRKLLKEELGWDRKQIVFERYD